MKRRTRQRTRARRLDSMPESTGGCALCPAPQHASPQVRTTSAAAVLGPFEDAAPCRVLFLRRHALFVGTTGSGKSGGLNVLMANLTACQDVIIWGIDLKKGMELGPWEECLDRLATTPEQAAPPRTELLRARQHRHHPAPGPPPPGQHRTAARRPQPPRRQPGPDTPSRTSYRHHRGATSGTAQAAFPGTTAQGTRGGPLPSPTWPR